MKMCPKCNTVVDDAAAFCPVCGVPFAAAQPNAQQAQPQPQPQAQPQAQTPPQPQPVYAGAPQYVPVVDIYDHTADFDKKDISDNKVYAILLYLAGVVGIIIALLGAKDSPYVSFHLRQAMKFLAVDILLGIVGVLLFILIIPIAVAVRALYVWTLIILIAVAVMEIILFVIKIICFFQICNGKAKEPAIIRGLGFLK